MHARAQRPRGSGKSPSAPHAGPAIQAQAWSSQGRSASPSAPVSLSLKRPPTVPTRGTSPARPGTASNPLDDQSNPVAVLLRDIGLRQYVDVVLENGFDDIETLLELEDGDMQDFGMAPGDAKKLRRHLQEMRGEPPAGVGSARLDESNEVVAFMQGAGLGQYAGALLQSGFDEMESLVEIEDSDLKDLGVPRGHQVKLRLRLREYEESQEGFGGSSNDEAAFGAGSFSLASSSTQAPSSRLPTPAVADFAPEALPRSVSAAKETKLAVERSWEIVQGLGVSCVGEMLKNIFFDLAPEVIEFFPPEVRHKYREWTADEGFDESDLRNCPGLRKLFGKVVSAVGYAVAGFHDSTRLVPMLTQLGARHAAYGVSQEHWDVLGEALNRTLQICLADAYTADVEAAWMRVYRFVAAVMTEGLRGAVSRTSSLCSAATPGGLEVPQAVPPTAEILRLDGPGVLQDVASQRGAAGRLPACTEQQQEPQAFEAVRLRPDPLETPTPKRVYAPPSYASSEAGQEPECEETPAKTTASVTAHEGFLIKAGQEPECEDNTKTPPEQEAPQQKQSFFERIREAKAFWHARA